MVTLVTFRDKKSLRTVELERDRFFDIPFCPLVPWFC